jgi:hypothetical protein
MFEITNEFDEFEQTYIINLKQNNIENKIGWFLNIFGMVDKDKKLTTRIHVLYFGSEYINIDKNSPLAFLLDHVRNDFAIMGDPYSARVDHNTVDEQCYYDIDKSGFEKIFNAKIIKMRLYGEGYFDFDLTDLTLNGLKKYYEDIVCKYNP